MASVSPALSLNNTLAYSDQFDYPLSQSELWYWQITSHYSLLSIQKFLTHLPKNIRFTSPFYHLPGRKSLSSLRKRRLLNSQPKYLFAKSTASFLSHIPTIEAIFITGSLSMNNCPKYDDIDFMIVTSQNTLWLTRLIVVLLLNLKSLRRSPSLPEHASLRVNNKICDNLYLDTNNLKLTIKNLYIAHEVLQAKLLFDKGGIHRKFILTNHWVKNYLPIAYQETLKTANQLSKIKLNMFENYKLKIKNLILWPINLFLFLSQYLYMYPKKTSEKISVGYAFFHPQRDSFK